MVDSLQETGTKLVDMSAWATETMVKFGVLLPEAKSLAQVSAQSSSLKTEEAVFKTEEVQAQNDRSSSGVGAEVKHEQGHKESSVRTTAGAGDGGGLQQLSDALIGR